MSNLFLSTAVEVETVALNSIVGATGLVAALSWLDAVRALVSMIIKVPRDGFMFFIVTALLTTLLSVLTYMIIKATARNVKIQKPSQVFAVTR